MKETKNCARSFFSIFNQELVEFSKQERRVGRKTPDFKVFKDKSMIAYCECKQFQRSEMFSLQEKCQNDTTYNSLSSIIERASEQFEDVNGRREVPNVLFIVNRRPGVDGMDYVSVYTGNFYCNSGKVLKALKRVSEGKIKDKKQIIDLCIWYTQKSGSGEFIFNVDSKFFEQLREFFGKNLDGSKIYRY